MVSMRRRCRPTPLHRMHLDRLNIYFKQRHVRLFGGAVAPLLFLRCSQTCLRCGKGGVMQGGQTHLELHRHANAWAWERGELGCSDCWSSSESSDAEVEDQATTAVDALRARCKRPSWMKRCECACRGYRVIWTNWSNVRPRYIFNVTVAESLSFPAPYSLRHEKE